MPIMSSAERSFDGNEHSDENLVRIDDLARVRQWLSSHARLSAPPSHEVCSLNGARVPTPVRRLPAFEGLHVRGVRRLFLDPEIVRRDDLEELLNPRRERMG